MANSACVPVYLETSLDTRLVVSVSSDDTVASLKRKIVAEHPVSFPVIGEIIVQAVKTGLKGVMFNLSDSMPVSALLNGINGNILCYVEAVTTNHERNLRYGRVDEELKVPIGGRIEDVIVNEVPHIAEEILADPLHNLAEAPSPVLKKTEKKKRRKNESFEDTSMRLTESRKREDEGFEGNFVQMEPGHMTSKPKTEVNVQASNPSDSNLIKFRGENASANGGKIKKEKSGEGEQTCIEDGGLADKSDKRRRRKNAKVPKPANDAIVAAGEFHNMNEVAHEAGLDKDRNLSVKNLGQDFGTQQIPVNANLMETNISNLVEHTPNEELISTTIHPYPNEEAGEPKRNSQAKGDSDFHDQPVTNQISDQGNTNQGTEENGDPTKVPNQSGTNYGIAELLEENARKDDTEKVQPSQEVTQMIGAVLGGVACEKKRRKKTKGFSSDVPSETPPIREYEPQVEDNTQITVEKDSKVPVKPGNIAETPNSNPSQLFKSREEPEGNSRSDKHIGSKNQPQNDQNTVAGAMEECRKEDANKNVSKEYAHVVGGDPGVLSREKKKRKKTKDAFTEVSTHELSCRENESCKEKASNLVLEKETSEVGAASFINNAAEAVKERSRKKHKKMKASTSDMPHEVLLVGEDDSEKADDKVHKSNQIVEKQRDSEIPQKSAVGIAAEANNSVPCQLDIERLEPDISFPADKDIRFHNKLGILQVAMADSKEDSGKVMEVIKETDNVTGGDPGVFSLEKRRSKKKKAASIEGLSREAMANESGQEKGNDLILEKEIIKEAVDTGLINIAEIDPGVVYVEKKRHKKTKAASTGGLGQKPLTEENGSCKEKESNLNLWKEISQEAGNAINNAGGDPGVASKEKRKRREKKAANTDMPPQELSAVENYSSKEGESNLMLEKEASKEADDARFTKNADDVAFPAPKSSDPEDSVNKTISDILADLKKGSPIPPDGQIDIAPQMQLLVNVAVDQYKTEQYLGLIVETKEKIKSGKESSNKTETLQNTMNLLTGDSVIAHDEKKRYKTAKATSIPIRDNGIETRETLVLASSQEDGARNQTLGSNMVEESVGDSKKKKTRKQEATNSGTKAPIDGATDEANGSIKNSVPKKQADASGKKEPETKIKKSLKEDNVPASLTFVDKKSSKGKSKVKAVPDKHSDASLADGTTQNAPNTPEKVQKSGDNIWAENRDKEAFTEGVRTKGSEVLHAATTEKMNFIDYFHPKGSDQPADATRAPLKETKERKKIQDNSFSKDCTNASVDTRVSEKAKKLIGKLQATDKPGKISKEHNLSENSNDKSRARTSRGDGVSKRDENMKCLLADMAVMSDVSTEDEEEVRSQPRRLMVAVRKVASKTVGEKMDASRKTSAVFSSGGLHDDMASETSTRDESKSLKGGLPIPGKVNGRAMMSPSSRWKDEQVADDGVPMSQESTRPKKKVNLSSVLRSSTSYKKAKISASQSQAEDREMIDVVFETQPDLAS